MKIQKGSANLFITLTKGTITVMHGTSGEVLMTKTNAPEDSWSKICQVLYSICNDIPQIENSATVPVRKVKSNEEVPYPIDAPESVEGENYTVFFAESLNKQKCLWITQGKEQYKINVDNLIRESAKLKVGRIKTNLQNERI